MRILLLHAIDPTEGLRRTTLNHSLCLPKYAGKNQFILHFFRQPVTDQVRSADIDVIVLDTTFLCYRWARPRSEFEKIRQKYDFIARSPALKLAFPQDDYDHSAVLDEWLHAWQVHVVFSPLAQFKDILYPRLSRNCEILPCLTGYIDDLDLLMLEEYRRPFEQRAVDVGYRARELPPIFGRLGRLKSEIGHRIVQCAGPQHGLVFDISTRPEDVLHGADWLKFLGNCRFLLGSPSGSSLLDRDGAIKDAYLAYDAEHPDASFEEVEAACFPGQDNIYKMAALGPRNIEAAVAKVGQILVEDPCWAPMEPNVHYVPLRADCRNVAEVLERVNDRCAVLAMIDACYDLWTGRDSFSYRRFVQRIIETIERKLGRTLAHEASSLTSPRALIAREQEIVTDLLRQQCSATTDQLTTTTHRLATTTWKWQQAVDEINALREEAVAQVAAVRRETVAQVAAVRQDAATQVAACQESAADRIATMVGELAVARHNCMLRRGRLGAVRELLKINDFIGLDGNATPGREPSFLARLYFSQRRGLAAKCIRAARAVFARTEPATIPPADVPDQKAIAPP